jgi:Mrp family chromosome partitioning ATPase
LMDSDAMVRVLEWAAENYDLVLLDTPPLSMAPDVTPLLSEVDGVVIVSRRRKDARDEARRLRDQLANHHAPMLGVVANGFKARAEVSHQYEYFFDAAGMSTANGRRSRTPESARSETRRS